MTKKGFLSTFYFGYLLITVSILIAIEHQFQLRIKTLINIREVYKTMDMQVEIIDFIQCELKNNKEIGGEYSLENVTFSTTLNADLIQVKVVEEGLSEILININDRREIIDYSVKS